MFQLIFDLNFIQIEKFNSSSKVFEVKFFKMSFSKFSKILFKKMLRLFLYCCFFLKKVFEFITILIEKQENLF